MAEVNRIYEVTVKKKVGTCDTPLFEKMAKKGDITSVRVKDSVGAVVRITGYADCHIKTNEKEFDITYYATDSGMLSSGSDVFHDSVVDYMGEVDSFAIAEIKTRKGTTYKAVPILTDTPTEV